MIYIGHHSMFEKVKVSQVIQSNRFRCEHFDSQLRSTIAYEPFGSMPFLGNISVTIWCTNCGIVHRLCSPTVPLATIWTAYIKDTTRCYLSTVPPLRARQTLSLHTHSPHHRTTPSSPYTPTPSPLPQPIPQPSQTSKSHP